MRCAMAAEHQLLVAAKKSPSREDRSVLPMFVKDIYFFGFGGGAAVARYCEGFSSSAGAACRAVCGRGSGRCCGSTLCAQADGRLGPAGHRGKSPRRKRAALTDTHAALEARQETISRLLGDAENPAHTRWNERAERLRNGWQSGGMVLRRVRAALHELHAVVFDRLDREDTDGSPSGHPERLLSTRPTGPTV
jgi:hypothetical protein